jgi:hypothetical protein
VTKIVYFRVPEEYLSPVIQAIEGEIPGFCRKMKNPGFLTTGIFESYRLLSTGL